MRKTGLLLLTLFLASFAWAQETADVSALSKEEEAAVAAILASQTTSSSAEEKSSLTEDSSSSITEEETEEEKEEENDLPAEKLKCLTVAYVDIDEAFNQHPRTIAVKEQIRLKILSKEEEVQGARQLIDFLTRENELLSAQLRELKPYYERIVVEPVRLQPQVKETADSLLMGNLLNRLTFAGSEPLSTSPLNTPAQREDLTARIAANKKVIAERSLFIDNYKYNTREEILTLEKQEVDTILKDIYTELKSFAQKRNIGALVRKDEVLYGEKPVNVTKDFISRLKKSKKYRKRGK